METGYAGFSLPEEVEPTVVPSVSQPTTDFAANDEAQGAQGRGVEFSLPSEVDHRHPEVPSQPTDVAANEAHLQGAQGGELPYDDTHIKPTGHSKPLVYAKPRDLPSFPSVGVQDTGSAAGAAASLGWANKKSPELWKPSKTASASASKAALMAKDYKPAPVWEPAASSHGAKAALLAAQSAKSTDAWKPSATDTGLSAATLAFKSDRTTPRGSRGDTTERQKSMLAAKGAMANRRRAGSAPVPRDSYPDEANATANALSAATRAHRPARSAVPSENAGAVPYTTMNRQMFTSHPPVKAEVDEQQRADVLHASAVAMAKKMYTLQQNMIDARKTHADATSADDQPDASTTVSDDAQPARFTTLQDAAYKQAQARLAKMEQENAKNRDYQEYYGTNKPVSRRFSVKGKLRRRSSSDGASIEDRNRSQQIRQQMSMFSNKLSEVDGKKRQHDQEVLLAAARRNVQARMKGMDDKISAETGMVPASTLTRWETKAHAAAQSRSNERASQHQGKINIGAGKYMSQEEIDAIAASRVQPVLDEINEKAENEHARQTELRLEMEKKKEEQEVEKARKKEIDDINDKLKEQEKAEQRERKAKEKQEAKSKKDEEKAAKAEQKRLSRAEKSKSVDIARQEEQDGAPTGVVVTNSSGQPVSLPISQAQASPTTDPETEMDGQSKSPTDSSQPGKVKTWFKSRFSRGPKSPDEDKPQGKLTRKSFVGGAALTGLEGNESSASLDNGSASVRAVAMAGNPQRGRRSVSGNRSSQHGNAEAVSPMSSEIESEEGYFRDEASLTPPKPIRDSSTPKSQSPVRHSMFHENI
ncbi:Uu.00g090410.m01.CDS01 [Anthostomella pinea]|uniref:Uu.00g090410.m01.CDS01 n=1 Tax=Anthostomella pinea TaxID=933095 RepID=A0AAI8VP28_9PEZI|nr:Uu.00g090410.m01.CDS01 [Anthostomella pinea]